MRLAGEATCADMFPSPLRGGVRGGGKSHALRPWRHPTRLGALKRACATLPVKGRVVGEWPRLLRTGIVSVKFRREKSCDLRRVQ